MSATRLTVARVWIEPGCIVCNACESNCPEVFHVQVESSTVRPEALNVEFLKPLAEAIRDAAEQCPAEVIKFEASAESE
jgi:ferredoxin